MDDGIWDHFCRVATRREGAVALTHGERAISFGALMREAEALAARLPLGPGDRAVLRMANGLPFALAAAAVWRRGAIPVLVNAEAPATHLTHAVATTEAAILLTDDPAAAGDARSTPSEVARGLWLAVGAAADPGRPAAPRGLNDIGSIVFTSGSTGRPKGVVQRAATLIDGAARIGAALGYREDDAILCPIPFAFDYGWGQFLTMMTTGLPLVLPEPRNAFGLCAALERHRPTVLAGVPAVYAELAFGLAPIADTARDSIRLLTNTGSKIPAPVLDRLVALFPGADLSLNYGLTETYRSAMLPVALARSRPESVGRAAPGVVLKVLRADGSPAAPGEEGEIVHAGAGVFDGYWNDPERSASVLTEVTLDSGAVLRAVRTGDFGHFDEDGLLYLHGRRDRQIKCMGVLVSPEEVEQALYQTGLLREVAITAAEHLTFGSLITAHVVPMDDTVTDKALVKALREKARAAMSAYMQPRAFVRHAALPRNANAKVDYAALARAAAPKD